MEIEHATIAFSALAQETRLKIFRLLVRQGVAGLSAGKIAEHLEIPANTLSFHLSHLAHAGLIESRREGRVIHYSIRVEGVRGLIAYLLEDCCMDRPELCDPTEAAATCCGVSADPPSDKIATRKGRKP